MLSQVTYQASAGALALIQHLVETPISPVVRVGHTGSFLRRLIESTKQAEVLDARLGARRSLLKIRQVLLIHCQHVVETFEVFALELACNARKFIPPLLREGSRARVGTFSFVVGGRPRAVHFHQVDEAFTSKCGSKDAFGRR